LVIIKSTCCCLQEANDTRMQREKIIFFIGYLLNN
jgi:hypothetical protein